MSDWNKTMCLKRLQSMRYTVSMRDWHILLLSFCIVLNLLRVTSYLWEMIYFCWINCFCMNISNASAHKELGHFLCTSPNFFDILNRWLNDKYFISVYNDSCQRGTAMKYRVSEYQSICSIWSADKWQFYTWIFESCLQSTRWIKYASASRCAVKSPIAGRVRRSSWPE